MTGQSPEEEKNLARARGLRHNLYEHVSLPLKTLDAVIAVLALAIVALVIFGIVRQ